jgi:phasin family protein
MRSVSEMISQLQEFVVDKAQALNDQVTRIRQGSVKSARVAVQGSAESLKGLKNPVRLVARSGVRLSTVSQTAVQELIELQSEALTAAITEFALRLERAARAASVGELVRDQVEMLPATRARVAGDAGRVLQIVTSAGREIRDLATETFERVTEAAEKPAPVRSRRRKAKKAARRSATRSRKAAA